VVAADFDGNGKPDLAAANGTAGTVSVYLRGAGGIWSQESGSPYPAAGASDIIAADLFGGPSLELAVAGNAGCGGFGYVFRRSAATFVQEGAALAIPKAISVASGDLNADGQPDLVFGSACTDSVYIVKRNDAGSGYDTPIQLPAIGHKDEVAIVDVTRDGRPDVIATNDNGLGVEVWAQKPDGSFAMASGFPMDLGGRTIGMDIADFNGDGRPDAAVADYSNDLVVVLLGKAGGGLVKEGSYPAGDGPAGVAAADFNADGRPDIAVADQAGKRVTVLLRTAANTFVADPSSPIVTNQAATGLDTADFNGDGRIDIAAANFDSNTITVLLNTTPPKPPPPPPPPPDLDKDNDGVQTPLDCDDTNPLIKPGAVDIPGDGINQDCSADGDADFPQLQSKLRYSVLTYLTGYSQFGKLTVAPVKAGDRITLQCKGGGCKFKKKVVKVSKDKASLSLLKLMRKAKLRKGAVVTLRMTRALTYGTYARWSIRAPKASKFSSKCLRPGKKKPVKCPS
jgi:hypothetical protein